MLTWTKNPILPVPSDEEIISMTPDELVAYHSTREEAIRNSVNDKYRYGWVFDNWKKLEGHLANHSEALISGGNRASKTQVGAYLIVKAAVNNPNSEIFCFSQTAEVSIRQQQSAVWEWLPAEFRTKQTGQNTYISYTRKNGFTDGCLILPNGSRISFKTYSQYSNNPTILEGAELGSFDGEYLNIGAWCDEFLGGPDMIETLRFRLATRNSKMILTFTPIFGMTDLVKQYVDGAKVIEKRQAELLGYEEIPTILECKNVNATVHYFWTEDNPWGGYERIKETLKHKPREEILVRAYGIASKSANTRFPKFNKAVNIVPADSIPTEGITRYHIVDPAGNKNWFMLWVAVDGSGTYWVYREWPEVGMGDWAKWSKGKWMPGPGAKGQGFGIRDYVDTIKELEGDEEIFERLIDPRLGAAKYQASDGSSSIIEDLADMDMVFIPAPGLDIDDGLQAMISKMAWDSSKPMDSVNRPHFYVSDECENFILALSEYTGEDGSKEAWKDPIDCARYAAIADLDHVDIKKMKVVNASQGGY